MCAVTCEQLSLGRGWGSSPAVLRAGLMRGAPSADCLPARPLTSSKPVRPAVLAISQMKTMKLREGRGLAGDIYHHGQASLSPCLDHSNSVFKPANDCKTRGLHSLHSGLQSSAHRLSSLTARPAHSALALPAPLLFTPECDRHIPTFPTWGLPSSCFFCPEHSPLPPDCA